MITLDDQIDHYELRYKLATADWPTARAIRHTLKCPPVHLCGRNKEQRINDLNPVTSHDVQLRACTEGRCGPWSNSARYKTKELVINDKQPSFTHDSRTYDAERGVEVNFSVPEHGWTFFLILERDETWVTIQGLGGIDASDYQFSLVVNSALTGIYSTDTFGHCDASEKANESDWIDGDKFMGAGHRFPLVRCELGHSAGAHFTVEARPNDDRSSVTEVHEEIISAALHQADTPVTYSSFREPTGVSPDGLDLTHKFNEFAIVTAGARWGLSIFESAAEGDANPGIDFHGAWRGLPEEVGHVRCRRLDVLACARVNWDADSHMLARRKLIVNYPPSATRSWTVSFEVASEHGRHFYYLPEALMHELGHMLGLGHPPLVTKKIIMYESLTAGDPQTSLTSVDRTVRTAVLAGQNH